MSRAPVRIHPDPENLWITIRDAHPHPEQESEDFLASTYRIHELGTDSSPQLLEADYGPNLKIDVHAHDHDEIIYVVAGAMIVGNKALEPGSSIFVAANTLYSFQAGEAGLRFLNFRPVRDDSHIHKDEFMRRKGAGQKV